MIVDIYGIYNKINGKIYIGQTKRGYIRRFTEHCCPKSGCRLLKNAINKYGKENFIPQLLDVAYSQNEANIKEKLWIKLLKTYIPKYGYNLSMGGSIGNFNVETLRKMSDSHKGKNNYFYGKKHSEESKKKMSEWKKEHYKGSNHPRAKSVRCIETNVIYDCVLDAHNKTGISAQHIGQVANKQYGRKTAGGFRWEWTK